MEDTNNLATLRRSLQDHGCRTRVCFLPPFRRVKGGMKTDRKKEKSRRCKYSNYYFLDVIIKLIYNKENIFPLGYSDHHLHSRQHQQLLCFQKPNYPG